MRVTDSQGAPLPGTTYEITFFDSCHFGADGSDVSAELMSGNKWRVDAALCPRIPVVDVKVGAANRCHFYLNQNVRGPDFWNGDVTDLRARLGFGL